MKTTIIALILFCISPNYLFSQSLFKGLEYGMSKKDVNMEFKKNKELYQLVDLGNGVTFQIYKSDS